MSYPSRDEILASSKGWVASFLNFLPGLGSGYLYQRRWKPYFFTIKKASNKTKAEKEKIISTTKKGWFK